MKLLKLIEYSIFPRRCELCGEIVEIDEERCEYCESAKRLSNPIFDITFWFDGLVSPYHYESSVRVGIHRFKYRGYVELAPTFADEMCKSIDMHLFDIPFDFITFVPLTKKKKRKRGYNQAELLAKEIAKKYDLQCVNTLIKTKETKNQQGSSEAERKKNLKNAFNIADVDVKGKNILLVDDVKTTGATLNECSKVLKKNGAERVYAVTIAVTQR